MVQSIPYLYVYEKDKAVLRRWQTELEGAFYLIDVAELEDLLVRVENRSEEWLLLQEGSLSFDQIKFLKHLLFSFENLNVLVLGEEENLRWCVEILKLPRVRMELKPAGKLEMIRLIQSLAGLGASIVKDSEPSLAQLFHRSVSNYAENKLTLSEALERFEKNYVNTLSRYQQ